MSRLVLLLLLILSACNSKPKLIRFAYDESDINYKQTAEDFKSVMDAAGYHIELVAAPNAIESARLLVKGEAELSIIMNQTDLRPYLGDSTSLVYSMMPLYQRVMYILYKDDNTYNRIDSLMVDKTFYVGPFGGEKMASFNKLMEYGGINNYEITEDPSEANIFFYWGDILATRADSLMNAGWKMYSMDPEIREGIELRIAMLKAFDLPPTVEMVSSRDIKTLSNDVFLITSEEAGSEGAYEFAEALFQARHELTSRSVIYSYMSEDFNRSSLPFPLHAEMDVYLRRDEPSFWEKYARFIAATFTVAVSLLAIWNSVKSYIRKRQKDRIDEYLRKIITLRNEGLLNQDQVVGLVDTALEKLFREKLEVQDFDALIKLLDFELKIHQNKKT